jgi:hypothetical protein
VTWQQWYSWFEGWPTDGNKMEECNMTVQHSVKKAAPLATCNKEEQHSVIHFLRREGVKPIEIHILSTSNNIQSQNAQANEELGAKLMVENQ